MATTSVAAQQLPMLLRQRPPKPLLMRMSMRTREMSMMAMRYRATRRLQRLLLLLTAGPRNRLPARH